MALDMEAANHTEVVMAGPAEGRVPAIPIRGAWCVNKRDARGKPAHDDGVVADGGA
jgi:hypothetical protein